MDGVSKFSKKIPCSVTQGIRRNVPSFQELRLSSDSQTEKEDHDLIEKKKNLDKNGLDDNISLLEFAKALSAAKTELIRMLNETHGEVNEEIETIIDDLSQVSPLREPAMDRELLEGRYACHTSLVPGFPWGSEMPFTTLLRWLPAISQSHLADSYLTGASARLCKAEFFILGGMFDVSVEVTGWGLIPEGFHPPDYPVPPPPPLPDGSDEVNFMLELGPWRATAGDNILIKFKESRAPSLTMQVMYLDQDTLIFRRPPPPDVTGPAAAARTAVVLRRIPKVYREGDPESLNADDEEEEKSAAAKAAKVALEAEYEEEEDDGGFLDEDDREVEEEEEEDGYDDDDDDEDDDDDDDDDADYLVKDDGKKKGRRQ